MIMREVRVRFAPSPTGPLHIGGVRTALYNYLFAKKYNGKFLLRIEDTDHSRYVTGAEEYIIESLNWVGLTFNEGPGIGGSYAPYRQSERKEIYRDYATKLVENGNAYYAFDTPEELEEMRKLLDKNSDKPPQYNVFTRNQMKNSITLSKEKVDELIKTNVPYVIRIKIPENEEIYLTDLIRGEVQVHSSIIDDKVLFKSDGMPTYHLANVVDDYLMKISHVIRGEEWLPSAPLHVLLYRFFGWENEMPQFAHLPLLLKPDGNGKLSKRDGDRLGFPVFPLQWTDPLTKEVSSGYRESGYLPEAVINMLAFLGWNPGTDRELFSLEELVQHFSLEHVHKAGAKFDPEKARWFNHHYIQEKDDEFLVNHLYAEIKGKNIQNPNIDLVKIIGLVKSRLNFLSDIWPQTCFFFESPQSYDKRVIKDKWKPDTAGIMLKIVEELDKFLNFKAVDLELGIKNFIVQNQLVTGQVMNALRLCLVGTNTGPSLFDLMEILGKKEVAARIIYATTSIQSEI
jgi:glutamyl-tRNA synthetase